MRLKSKVAVITGATSGIGRATAILFAQEGAKVVMCGRRKELGEEIANGIRKEGGEVTFVQADVSNPQDVQKVIKTAVDKYGPLNVIFNNAGINYHDLEAPDKEPLERWKRLIDINLTGVFLGIKYAVPEMRKAGGGSIINCSSVNDSHANEMSASSYYASKGGITALTRKAAMEYATENIRVNCVNPGPIATEISNIPWGKLEDPKVIEERKKRQPLPRMGHPMDVAYAVLYFASEESAFVTGASLVIDGGRSVLY